MDTLNCNGCGAILEVARGTRFVTCRQCGVHLTVVETETSLYTELQATSVQPVAAEQAITAATPPTERNEEQPLPPSLSDPVINGEPEAISATQRAPITWRHFWRWPIFWLCLIGFMTASAAGSNTVDTRRTAVVLGGPLLLLTGAWTVVWLGRMTWHKKTSPGHGLILMVVTGVVMIGLLVLGFFVIALIPFALFWKS